MEIEGIQPATTACASSHNEENPTKWQMPSISGFYARYEIGCKRRSQAVVPRFYHAFYSAINAMDRHFANQQSASSLFRVHSTRNSDSRAFCKACGSRKRSVASAVQFCAYRRLRFSTISQSRPSLRYALRGIPRAPRADMIGTVASNLTGRAAIRRNTAMEKHAKQLHVRMSQEELDAMDEGVAQLRIGVAEIVGHPIARLD